jgi:predicted PurR-regulated permease PerM
VSQDPHPADEPARSDEPARPGDAPRADQERPEPEAPRAGDAPRAGEEPPDAEAPPDDAAPPAGMGVPPEVARDVSEEHPFGRAGRPLRRNPFVTAYVAGLGLLLAYATFLAVRNAAGILILIFIALFLAIGLNPAVVRLQHWGLRRGLAVTIVALTVVLLLCGGIGALVPPVVSQTTSIIEDAPSYVESLRGNRVVNDLIERFDLVERAQSLASPQTLSRVFGGVFGGVSLIFGTLFRVLTVLVLTIYFMIAFDRMKNAAYKLVPVTRRERVRLITDEILTKVGAYMVGALSIAVLAGVSTFVFALIAGLPYPFALAVAVAVCDLIPQIGATIGAVAVTIVGLSQSITIGIVTLVFFIVYQQIENYLIYPKVMRRSVKVSDVAAIVAALLGVALFGVIGALVAIPAVAAVQLIVREVVLPRMQER